MWIECGYGCECGCECNSKRFKWTVLVQYVMVTPFPRKQAVPLEAATREGWRGKLVHSVSEKRKEIKARNV
jgi:hypothetical protein